jgi:hypothetical protein
LDVEQVQLVPETPHFTSNFLQSQLPDVGQPEAAQQMSLPPVAAQAYEFGVPYGLHEHPVDETLQLTPDGVELVPLVPLLPLLPLLPCPPHARMPRVTAPSARMLTTGFVDMAWLADRRCRRRSARASERLPEAPARRCSWLRRAWRDRLRNDRNDDEGNQNAIALTMVISSLRARVATSARRDLDATTTKVRHLPP